MNNLDQQFQRFKKVMIDINNYQSFTRSLSNKLSTYKQELEKNNIIKKRSDMTENDWSSHINFSFKDYSTGQIKSLETSKFKIEDSERIELELINRQYQFMLLNAFEAFESYLKSANIFLNKLENENGFSSTKFIVKLHKAIPALSLIIKIRSESDSSRFLTELDLFLTFGLIEQLRHQIAHTSGYAEDKPKFIDFWLRRIGSYRNGQIELEAMNILDYFFGVNEYKNWICLTDVRDKENAFRYDDRLGTLIEELTSYTIFIHAHIKSANAVS